MTIILSSTSVTSSCCTLARKYVLSAHECLLPKPHDLIIIKTYTYAVQAFTPLLPLHCSRFLGHANEHNGQFKINIAVRIVSMSTNTVVATPINAYVTKHKYFERKPHVRETRHNFTKCRQS